MKAGFTILGAALLLFGGCKVLKHAGTITPPKPLWETAREAILDGLASPPESYQDYPYNTGSRPKGGVFVRLCAAHEELGCQGFLSGIDDYFLAVRLAARNAAFFDKRYPPVDIERLRMADLEITTIGELQRMREPLRFRLGKDAVYLRYHSLTAFMQPSVAREHDYTKQEFLDAVARKAGLKAGMWRNPAVELYFAGTREYRRSFFTARGEQLND